MTDRITPLPWELSGPVEPKGYGKFAVTLYGANRPSNSEHSKRAVVAYLSMADEHWSPIDGIRVEQDMEANAAYIVHCANNYPKLEALNAQLAEELRLCWNFIQWNKEGMQEASKRIEDLLARAKAKVAVSGG